MYRCLSISRFVFEPIAYPGSGVAITSSLIDKYWLISSCLKNSTVFIVVTAMVYCLLPEKFQPVQNSTGVPSSMLAGLQSPTIDTLSVWLMAKLRAFILDSKNSGYSFRLLVVDEVFRQRYPILSE